MTQIAWQYLTEQASQLFSSLREEALGERFFSIESLQGILRLTQPVAPFNQPAFIAPLVGLGGMLLGLILAGVAVSSFAALLTALLALALLLSRMFGFSVELGPLGAAS
ncbi:MAG TPA: hypothetical protein VEI94_03870 [Candidatus Bathyarchaeia archaeon]|nr:hypothetical protein [Candidatus Bathyarchaeia archaeon]